ncbi:mucin-5B-like [Phyllobates terribilis]|uniref:mucin-5B-like n=1 Tax=Phyllobates terribilis TaxID=111132 RepID=UPI003CCAA631
MGRTSAVLLASLTLLVMVIAVQSAAIIRCVAGREYNDCSQAICQQTCDNMNAGCSDKCVPGCICKKGTVQNAEGECVKKEDCCSGNTVYDDCGNNYGKTCEDAAHPNSPAMCAAVCSSGCFCKPGYVLNNSGECVLPEDCPKSSNTN